MERNDDAAGAGEVQSLTRAFLESEARLRTCLDVLGPAPTLWCGRSAELLGEPDEKPLRTADVAEPVRVLILDHFADELRTVLAEPLQRVLDVVHGEHDAQIA